MKFKTKKDKEKFRKFNTNQGLEFSILITVFMCPALFMTMFYSIKLAFIWFLVSFMIVMISLTSSRNYRLCKEELIRDGVIKL